MGSLRVKRVWMQREAAFERPQSTPVSAQGLLKTESGLASWIRETTGERGGWYFVRVHA